MRVGRGEGVRLFTSAPLLAELPEILFRPKFEKKIAASLLSVDQLVDLYTELAALARPTPVPRLAPGPDDDVVIGTAFSAKAYFLITGMARYFQLGDTRAGGLLLAVKPCKPLSLPETVFNAALFHKGSLMTQASNRPHLSRGYRSDTGTEHGVRAGWRQIETYGRRPPNEAHEFWNSESGFGERDNSGIGECIRLSGENGGRQEKGERSVSCHARW